MSRVFLFISGIFLSCHYSFAQPAMNKTLYIIDSIPLLQNPKPWNIITGDDIADYHVLTNRDSLKRLGWENLDTITYIFTKSYRLRPDSIKKIPSLKQMIPKIGSGI